METQFILLDQPGYRLPPKIQENVQEFLKLSEYTAEDFIILRHEMMVENMPMNGWAFIHAARMICNLLKNTSIHSMDYMPLRDGIRESNITMAGFLLLPGKGKPPMLKQGERECLFCSTVYNGARCPSCGAPHRYKLNNTTP